MSARTLPRTTPPDFLRVGDLDEAQFAAALDLAEEMKHSPGDWLDSLRSETLACFFEKPSTRTRVSFAAAAHRLGMLPLVLRPDELQLGRGETVADTARTLAGFCAAIVIRTFAQATVSELAQYSSVPVINALTDDHHPCQALADFLTLREVFGRLDGLRLAYIGDSDNVARSLIEAGALSGVDVVVA
ncbi:MAG: ornithine carbamoyltransferase, partial [Acidimicrobiales bacterium]